MFANIVALVLFVFPSTVPGWGVYRPEGKNFEIGVPGPWKIHGIAPNLVRLTPSETREWMYGVGLPAPPTPWVDIYEPLKGTCAGIRQSGDFKKTITSSGTFFREKVVCRSGIVISLGYWENDKDNKDKKQVLEQMFKSFKTLSWEK